MKPDLLDIYSDYLISQNHHATATGLSAMFDGEISHDQISRHLRSGDFGSKALWSYVKSNVRRHEQKTGGVLLLDDTISEKAYTDENALNCWHFSHAKNRHIKGINIVSCLVRYGDIALPVGYETVKKNVVYSDIATRKQKRKSQVSKYDAARNALNQGVDYANGGCFWDGYDLKTSGSHHYKYRHGFHFTHDEHNIFNVLEPPPRNIVTKKGRYDYEYESVATHGKTIFWKLNNNFLKATGNKQCQ